MYTIDTTQKPVEMIPLSNNLLEVVANDMSGVARTLAKDHPNCFNCTFAQKIKVGDWHRTAECIFKEKPAEDICFEGTWRWYLEPKEDVEW